MSEYMEKFLSSVRKSTANSWKRGISLFTQWYGKDVDTILQERKEDLIPKPNENFIDQKNRADRFERELEKFHKWMVDNGYKINTARSYCTAVLQLFRYYSMPIRLRTGSPISRTTISTEDFRLKPKHIRAMFHVAKDLRSKLLISMGNDLGWGISDVIKIRRDELPDLNQTPPIYWERTRGKTKQIAKTCLSETTVILLKEYLFNFPTDNPYLFHSNGSHISDVTVNQRLRDLARDAGIKIGNKKLHWHLFRKMIISQAKNLGIDPDTINVMVGKAVPKSLLTYMTDINVIEAFNKLQTVTRINGELIKPKTLDIESMGKTIVELTNKIKELESRKELVSLGETVSELTNKIKEQEARIKDQTDRIFELEQLVPPLEELMRFKWLLYGQKQRKQKQTKKPRPKDG